ncbi:MAG: DUF2334 domain-containing protein [Blastocatellia bacterium]
MRACYLLRFDDLCPTMNWAIWDELEAILVREQICPLLAVVPDNQDPELQCAPPAPDFWERVRSWQARGWNVALHGYQHKFVTAEAGLIGLNPFSEFAGLPAPAQKEKLARALAIFRREKLVADAWSAPAHSFDQTTLQCLADMGLRTISDGLFLLPQLDAQGFFWLPQQLSDFRSFPVGVFTICLHINQWDHERLRRFEQNVMAYRGHLTSLAKLRVAYEKRRPLFSAVTLTKWGSAALRLKQRLRLRSRLLAAEKIRPGMAA